MDLPGFSLDLAALKETTAAEPGELYDLVILGGGPAAMSAAVYAARKLIKLAIVTRDFGGQMLETSEIENWLGAQSVRARDLVSQFEDHVKSYETPIALGPSITAVKKEDELFKVETDDGKTYSARTIILATGKRHQPLNVPGEKELAGRGVAYCATCDAPFYRDKKAVVVGGGNSAFTTALDLLKVNARVTLVNFIEGWQADAVLRERVRGFGGAEFHDHHQVVRLEGKDKLQAVVVKSRKGGEEKRLAADGVFIEIGLLPNSEPVRGLVELNERGEVIVDCAGKTNVPGFFAAGDVTIVPHKQIIISAGEGAKAALSAYARLVEQGAV